MKWHARRFKWIEASARKGIKPPEWQIKDLGVFAKSVLFGTSMLTSAFGV
jgi:hypothetical protein